ncbi:hypothetical protein FOZ60_010517 [Perkinsus olseni]|uniref:Uncharacterized protein n=1 Tax=Perkinsus olseni TaxID=32597 RepID=A0A7J6PC88_PEROL|nr:hypothetical protein FOZ60_010517 [Perkinsus olseni]
MFEYGLHTSEICVGEYDVGDTPSGFLRWSKPARVEPSWSWRLSAGLEAASRKYPTSHMIMWVIVLGLWLTFFAGSIWTFLTVAYRLPSVLGITVQKVSVDQQVWCGMVSLAPGAGYCARGTVDLRIQNGLWTDLTIVEASLAPLKPRYTSLREINYVFHGWLVIGGFEAKAMSEGVYTVPVFLQAAAFEGLSPVNGTSIEDWILHLELRVLGYYFPKPLFYGTVRVPSFTIPIPPAS